MIIYSYVFKRSLLLMNSVMNQADLHYKVILSSPEHHYFDVTLTIANPDPNGQVLRLPAWIPGSYMIRDFAKNIVQFEANCDGKRLSHTRVDKSSWQLARATQQVTVNYRIYAFDPSIRAAYLDFGYGFANGTSLFLEVLGHSELPVQVEIKMPSHSRLKAWSCATTLTALKLDDRGFGQYQASNYDELIDHPLLMGELTYIPFQVRGVLHRLVLAGKHYASQEKLAAHLTQICEAEHELWGESPEFERYDFLTIVTENGFGGLEHRSSTALMCPRETLEFGTEDTPSDGYLDFLSLCSHEYFHNWNIKRLKPKAFIPYELDQEAYTRELWWYEGVTSFYDDLMLFRAGVIDEARYLKLLSKTLSRGLRGVGHTRQSLEESSFLAWTTFYQQNENAMNAISSYYAKGACVALFLDLSLRSKEKSLDDVLRALWQQFGTNWKGTTFDEIFSVIEDLGGKDIAQQTRALVEDPKPPELEPLLQEHGLNVTKIASDPLTLLPSADSPKTNVFFGAAMKETSSGLEVLRVMEDSPAARAGLSAKDTLIAVDHLKATSKQWNKMLTRFQPGQECAIHFFKDHQLHESIVVWQAPKEDSYVLELAEGGTLPWDLLTAKA